MKPTDYPSDDKFIIVTNDNVVTGCAMGYYDWVDGKYIFIPIPSEDASSPNQ